MENSPDFEFLPRSRAARLAVEKARQKVLENNQFIADLKRENQLDFEETEENEAEMPFRKEDYDPYDLTNIRTSNGFSDFFREIFNI